jgi:hypothetical protein
MLHDLPLPAWAIFVIVVVVVIGTFVLITGRNAEGGVKGRASHGWSRWKALSQKVGDVQARIFLSIFYFTLMAPFGLVFGVFKDPLCIKQRPSGSFWVERKPVSEKLADAHRQF